MSSWITFTCLAALMQAVRTAGQKQLSNSISPMSSTLVRYVFGLPFVVVYLGWLAGDASTGLLRGAAVNPRFLGFAIAASLAQIVATVLLIRVFSFRNFAVGTSFAKTEAIQTAVIGTVFFGSTLSVPGWLAILIGFAGIFIVSMPAGQRSWDRRNVTIGLLSGTCFALTSLWLRQASLSLGLAVLPSAAITLLFMVSMQSVLCLLWTLFRERQQFALIAARWPLALFVGCTSALGSIGWFTAMTWQEPALVKALGQIEFVFSVLLSLLFFRERISRRELLGMSAIVGSVILLLAGR